MIIGINGRIGSGKDTIGKIIQYLSYCDTFGRMSYSSWEMLDKTYNKSEWQIKKFADKLKDIVCLLIGCTREQLEDREFKEKELGEEWFKTIWWIKSNHNNLAAFNSIEEADEAFSYYDENYLEEVFIASEDVMLTPRLILQLLGTQCGRQIIHPDIWINALFANYNADGFNYADCVGKEIKGSWTYPNWIITDMRFPNEMKAVKDKGGITIRVNRINIKTIKDKDSTIKYIPIPNIDYKEHESETALDGSTFDYEINNNDTIEDLIKQVKEILIKEKLIN